MMTAKFARFLCALLAVSEIFFVGSINDALSADSPSTFVRLQFGSDASIEVPRNWIFLDQNIRQHLNAYSETVARFAGLEANQGNNQILVAANAYMADKRLAASVRLSVRVGSSASQEEIRTADLSDARREAEHSLRQLQRSLPDSKGMKLLGVHMEKLGRYHSIVTETQVDYVHGSYIDRLDVISLGTRTYKLYTSYQKSNAWMFEPIIRRIRQSLRFGGD